MATYTTAATAAAAGGGGVMTSSNAKAAAAAAASFAASPFGYSPTVAFDKEFRKQASVAFNKENLQFLQK